MLRNRTLYSFLIVVLFIGISEAFCLADNSSPLDTKKVALSLSADRSKLLIQGQKGTVPSEAEISIYGDMGLVLLLARTKASSEGSFSATIRGDICSFYVTAQTPNNKPSAPVPLDNELIE